MLLTSIIIWKNLTWSNYNGHNKPPEFQLNTQKESLQKLFTMYFNILGSQYFIYFTLSM
jgi:hypothetical protein